MPADPSLLFVNQHYWPDVASTGQHLTDLAEHLAGAGFDVRVLGHRSILCAPRRGDMREVINERIKLREHMADWFEADDDVPFMMKVYPIRPEKQDRVPAVTHVDGTGRPQTVTPGAHPFYHRLISAFRERTGVPMVLNTSFNGNEPIIHRPEEALDCILRTDMDVLALGRWVVWKAGTGKAAGAPGRREGADVG